MILRFLKARRRVPKLYAQADDSSRALLGVLNSALRFNLTEEERFWMNKIEALRKELNSSTQLITRVLFGLPPECPNPPGKPLENGEFRRIYGSSLSDKNKRVLERFLKRRRFRDRLLYSLSYEVYRQSTFDNLILKVLIALNRP